MSKTTFTERIDRFAVSMSEAADIGNLAMMIVDACRAHTAKQGGDDD